MVNGYQIVDCTGIEITDSGSNVVVSNARLANAIRSNKPLYISNLKATISGASTLRSGYADATDTAATDGRTVRLIQKDARFTFAVDENNVTISYSALTL